MSYILYFTELTVAEMKSQKQRQSQKEVETEVSGRQEMKMAETTRIFPSCVSLHRCPLNTIYCVTGQCINLLYSQNPTAYH